MKKLLILFLLAFPILIFALINISASIIGWYIPLPVEKIEVSIDNLNWSDSVDLKVLELTGDQQTFDVFVRVLPANARNHKLTSFSSDELTSEIKSDGYDINKDGQGKVKVTVYEYGYNEITLITDDGKYEATIDVSVVNPDDDPNVIKSIILEYKDRLHSNYQFGYSNDLQVNFKYFPKEADPEGVLDQISTEFDGVVKETKLTTNSQGYFTLDFIDQKQATDFKVITSEGRTSNYTFNTNQGYNLKGQTDAEIRALLNKGYEVYQLEEFDIKSTLIISNGTKYEGNNFKITHKTLTEGVAVSVLGNNTHLNQIHIVGPLTDEDGQVIPYQNVVNLKMTGSIDAKYQKLTNSVIENGRYTLITEGKSYEEDGKRLPTVFEVENVKFIGALMAGLVTDNQAEGALMINSNETRVKNLSFEWCGVGILLQNQALNDGQKGFAKLVVKPHDDDKLINSVDGSNNWRNLDEASGMLKEQNVLGLLDELKKYDNVTHKEGKYYYVSAIIMIRGGATNHSKVELDNKSLNDLIVEKRTPSTMEAMHPAIGGRFPFTVYLLDPKYYQGGDLK